MRERKILFSMRNALRLLSGDGIKDDRLSSFEQMEAAVKAALPVYQDMSWQEFARGHFDPNFADGKLMNRKHYQDPVKWTEEDRRYVTLSPDIFVHNPWESDGVPVDLDVGRLLPENWSDDLDERWRYAGAVHVTIKDSLEEMFGQSVRPFDRSFGIGYELGLNLAGAVGSWGVGRSGLVELRERGGVRGLITQHQTMFRLRCEVTGNISIFPNVVTLPEELKISEDELTQQERWLKRRCLENNGRLYLTTVYAW